MDSLEPIYNDGGSNIIQLANEFENIHINEYSNSLQKGAKLSLELISRINISKFNEKLINRGLKLTNTDVKNIIKKIILNLRTIQNSKPKEFNEEYIKNSNFNYNIFDKAYFAFFDDKQNIEICDKYLKNCFTIKYSKKIFNNLIKNQYTFIENNLVRITRITKNDYKKNLDPEINGIQSMQHFKKFTDSEIYVSGNSKININHKDKIIEISQNKIDDKIIFFNGKLEKWKIIFKGKEIKNFEKITNKFDNNGISGCLTFINLRLKNISIKGNNFNCSNAINLIGVEGTINQIIIQNSIGDGFDADFSNINVDTINIQNSLDECISVKGGKYYFRQVKLYNCDDSAVSSGEYAELNIENLKVLNSTIGLLSKDSALINLNYAKLEKVDLCVKAVRRFSNYSGGLIKAKSDNFFCSREKYFFDKNSFFLRY